MGGTNHRPNCKSSWHFINALKGGTRFHPFLFSKIISKSILNDYN